MAFANIVCCSKKSALAIPSESKHLLVFIFGNKGDATDFFVIIFLPKSENESIAVPYLSDYLLGHSAELYNKSDKNEL